MPIPIVVGAAAAIAARLAARKLAQEAAKKVAVTVSKNAAKSKKVDVEDPNRKSIARFLKKPKQKTKEQLRMEKLEDLDRLEKTLLS